MVYTLKTYNGRWLQSYRGWFTKDPYCCCGPCCGRHLPGENGGINEYPYDLYVSIEEGDCPCLTTTVVTLSWDNILKVWNNFDVDLTGCSGHVDAYMAVSCGGSGDGPASVYWNGIVSFLGPCVDFDTASADMNLRFAMVSCKPVEGTVTKKVSGVNCCGRLFDPSWIVFNLYE